MDDPVEAQVEAYNAHDLAAFVATFAPDVVVTDPDGRELLRGRDALEARYAELFAEGRVRAEVPSRIRAGAWVVDEERVSGLPDGDAHVLVAYEVRQGRIVRVIFLR